MSLPTIRKLTSITSDTSRYAVVLDGKDIGILAKEDDTFTTTHKWKAWAGAGVVHYVGEFDIWHDAVAAVKETYEGLIRANGKQI